MKKCLITAGPTVEKIDPVRFISNRSSGRMGYALAQAAREAGFAVTLISGPVHLEAPEGVRLISIESAAEMAAAAKSEFPDAALTVMAAAVADYRPKTVAANKIKKQPGDLRIELERTEDILAALGNLKQPGQILVGFAAETEDLLARAAGKMARKNLDWIAANTVSDGFGRPDNRITLLGKSGEKHELPRMDKLDAAREIIRLTVPPEFLKD